MVESATVPRSKKKIWFDVMKTWCPNEIVETYFSLDDNDARIKMLDALKAKIMHTLLEQNKKQHIDELIRCTSAKMDSKSSQYLVHEILLQRAVMLEGSTLAFNNFKHIQNELRYWGTRKRKCDILQEHEDKSYAFKSRFVNNHKTQNMSVLERFKTLSSDATVTKHTLDTKDLTEIKSIQIKDLKLFQTCIGCSLEGTLVGYARLLVGLTTLLKDDTGNIVQLTIYNFIPDGPEKFQLAEKMFPHGQRIIIKEPFMKIFRDGNHGIRVDNPKDICIVKEEQENIDDIRIIGKTLMESEQYLSAFELYYSGIRRNSDLLIPLLNNRSQTELKLEQFEKALLDASAVLFLNTDGKAQKRYRFALDKIKSSCGDIKLNDIWKMLLRRDVFLEDISKKDGYKEVGNELYAKGKYLLAKEEYTSAIFFPDISILLTNIALSCIHLGIFQTAISACNACLRISRDNNRRQKAYYLIAKSFLMLRKPELYEIMSPKLNYNKELEKTCYVLENCESIVKQALLKCNKNYDYSVSDIVDFFSKSCDLVSDFLQPDTLEHVYIRGKGRGIRAIRHIKKGELLLVDHPIVGKGADVSKTKTFTRSFNFNKHIAYGIGDVKLTTDLLTLIKYDGLLGKKLLSLEHNEGENGSSLPIVDLNHFSYRHLSEEVPPFLCQASEVVGYDISKINQVTIENIISVNTFNHDSVTKDSFCQGSALCMRISLFNHDDDHNCLVLPFGKALILFSIRDIPRGTELTIFYNDNCEWKTDLG